MQGAALDWEGVTAALLRTPEPAEGRKGAPPLSLHQSGDKSPTQGLKDLLFPAPASHLAPCTRSHACTPSQAGTRATPDARLTPHGAEQPGAKRAVPRRHRPPPDSPAHGREHGGQSRTRPAWFGTALTHQPGCQGSRVAPLSFLPKERTPELGSARWGGSSAPLILGTQSSLGSQGASSPVHPALTLGTPGFGQAPSLPGALKGHYPDPAAPPDPSEQPRSWPGSGERGEAAGSPPIPAAAAGATAAALNRCTGCAAAGKEILASASKACGLRAGLKRSLSGASACNVGFCYQTPRRGRENSCVCV